jgi:hypothetical protein
MWANIKHEQWIKCGIDLDEIAKQRPTTKIIKIIWLYTQIMINILIIFLTQYFQEKNDFMVRISHF